MFFCFVFVFDSCFVSALERQLAFAFHLFSYNVRMLIDYRTFDDRSESRACMETLTKHLSPRIQHKFLDCSGQCVKSMDGPLLASHGIISNVRWTFASEYSLLCVPYLFN